ncbi:MAG: glycosyltransferase [Desulfobacterota bacterium]|nr:glycosyltransferase [Thermodesulfobacteriota bacterium]
MKCSVIIRSYNEEKHLQRLLDGVFSQQFAGGYEVILVDSGSNDRTLQIAAAYPVRTVHIKKEYFSFGYSLNQGIKASSGEYCAFISAHCYPANNRWLTTLLEPFRDEKIALVYGRQIGNHVTKYSEKQIFAKWFPPESVQRQHSSFCNNANAAIRRKLWEQEPFNEALTGLEDLAWAQRMIERGYFLAYNADAVIYHVHEETYAQIFNRYKREAITLHSILRDSRFTFWDFIKLSLMNIAVDSVHALRDRVYLAVWRSIVCFRLAQFYGTYQGYKFRKAITQELRERFYYPTRYRKEMESSTQDVPLACKTELL